MKRAERWDVWALLALALIALAGDLFVPDDVFVSRFMDDAYYYFTIARHLASGDGFTFDGLHRTNGFHPLWLFCLIPVFGLFKGDIAPLRIVALVEIGLLAGTIVALYGGLRPRIGRAGAVVAGLTLVVLPRWQMILRQGMESALLIFLLVLAWRVSLRGLDTKRPKDFWMAGGCWALCFLARVEMMVAPLIVLLVHHAHFRAERRSAVALALPALTCAGIYAAVNQIAFGSWLPISGVVKNHIVVSHSPGSHFVGLANVPWIFRDLIGGLFDCQGIVANCGSFVRRGYYLFLLALAVAILLPLRSRVLAAIRDARVGFLLAICTTLVLIDLGMFVWVTRWKEGPIVLSTAVLAGLVVRVLPRPGAKGALAIVAAGVVVTSCVRFWGPPARPDIFSDIAASGRWLREHLPPGEKVGSWNAGTIGYFSRRPVVNLDGLVNDIAFFRRVVVKNDLDGYLRDEGIRWLADLGCEGDPSPDHWLVRYRSRHLSREFELVRDFRLVRETKFDCSRMAVVWRRRQLL